MKGIQDLWRGDVPLPRAFWHWAVLGGLAVNIVTSGLTLALLSADQVIAALIVGYGCSIPYNILVTLGVWRAAGRFEGERRWADLARIATVGGMILLSVT